MKALLIFIISLPFLCFGQTDSTKAKIFTYSKNDALVSGCFFGYGFAKGWADQVEYHHFAMQRQFPSLFKNGKTFWDGRYDEDGIWDAKHMLAAMQGAFMTTTVIIKFGEYKHMPKKHKFYRICFDIVKYDFSRRLGFFLSYNVINKNQLFK